MSSKLDKSFPANPEVTTPRYRGPDRRNESDDKKENEKPSGEVKFDAKGNPVWETRVDEPKRRQEDKTIDLLKCLDVDTLSVAVDDDEPKAAGYDPYAHE